MKVQSINNANSSTFSNHSVGNKNNQIQNPIHPQMKEISNLYYQPVNFVQAPAFKGKWFEDNYVKNVNDKEYQGTGLMKKNADGKFAWYDFDKVGWSNLSQEPLDWKHASETDFYVFQHANSLAETKDTSWVKRFNHHNVKKPLATSHAISSRDVIEPPAVSLYNTPTDDLSFATNIKELMNMNKHKNLDVPITDKDGKLAIDCAVFDTETTGTNNDNFSKPLDKIIQIGAIQVKNGTVDSDTGYSQLINPQIHINEGASAVNHITDDIVKDKPIIDEVLPNFVNNYLNKKNGVIVAYNGKFDLKMLNNAIKDHNKLSDKELTPIKYCNVVDPFILTQRIHPYIGARKRLSEQYKFFFCKNMDDAHDAFADVKGTVNMLKYDLYFLNEHRKDKTKPLTVRDVLFFQNGVVPKNLDLKLDHQGCNAGVNFKTSYRCDSVNVTNYFKGYKITKDTLENLKEDIGEENIKKLKKNELVGEEIDLNGTGKYPANPAETANREKTGGLENSFYVTKNNFMKVLDLAKIDAYKDKSKEEVKELIADNAKDYVNEDSVDLWVKNPNPKDIKDGNDLPVFKISKKVMLEEMEEKEAEKAKAKNAEKSEPEKDEKDEKDDSQDLEVDEKE